MDKSHVLEEIEIGRAEFDALLGQKLDAWLMGMLPLFLALHLTA